MSCDLHIHSTCSDGAVPIERLASIAARTGALTSCVSFVGTSLEQPTNSRTDSAERPQPLIMRS